MTHLEGVIFDCDGTLVDSERLGNEVLAEALAERLMGGSSPRNLPYDTSIRIISLMARTLKPLKFLGSSQDDIRAMPSRVRHALGVELMWVQFGDTPSDFKTLPTVGAGVCEIRVRDTSGAFRAIYVASFAEAILCCTRNRKRRARPRKPIWIWPRTVTG